MLRGPFQFAGTYSGAVEPGHDSGFHFGSRHEYRSKHDTSLAEKQQRRSILKLREACILLVSLPAPDVPMEATQLWKHTDTIA